MAEIALPWQPDDWRQLLRSAIRDTGTLLDALGLSADQVAVDFDPDFPVRVPQPFLKRMRRGDPTDPLLLQVLPLRAERDEHPGYVTDALAEGVSSVTPGLLQKYDGRMLAVATPACAVHCRYCFRRHFPYGEAGAIDRRQIDIVARRSDISELILSGGDPLTLTDDALADLFDELAEIPHLRRIRLHTRVPIVLPQRVTPRLTETLTGARQAIAVVVHSNHPQELGDEVALALAHWRQAGIVLLNQSVLLAGINDNVDVLAALSERLFDCGVMPYYLHLADAVAGTAHFDVADRIGRDLIDTLRAALPGYLVPRLVREVPGESAKQIVR